MLEKWECCPECYENGELWLYDFQVCKKCGLNRLSSLKGEECNACETSH